MNVSCPESDDRGATAVEYALMVGLIAARHRRRRHGLRHRASATLFTIPAGTFRS